MKKKLFACILAIVLCLTQTALLPMLDLLDLSITASAEEYSGICGDNLTWTFNEETGELTISGTGNMRNWTTGNAPWYKYNSSIKNVIIDNGVTSIGDSAFYYCYNLASVTIGKIVGVIGDYAFGYCYALESILIPNSVWSIGSEAFYNCDSLKSVEMPESVTDIGGRAFGDCDSLECISVDGNNNFYSSDEFGVLYNKNKTKLIQYPVGNMKISYTIPDSVISIGAYAFCNFNGLTSITIPSSVTNIGVSAFNGCSNLTDIIISESVNIIGDNAFYETAYYNDESNWENNILYIGKHLIKSKSNEDAIKEGTLTIAASAFSSCKSLASITIPDTVTSIGGCAFYSLNNLTRITIPDSVMCIGNSAFDYTGYYNDESNWENGVLYIGRHLIEAKDTISGEYTINNGTLTIADRAFNWCVDLTSVTIPDSVTEIGDEAFYYCTSLESIIIPNSVTSIGDKAFAYCNLTSIEIPNSVTSIGEYAFDSCDFSRIEIPASVSKLGDYLFNSCDNLEKINVDKNNMNYSSDDSGVLYNKDKTVLIKYPAANTRTLYTIPNGVKVIGKDAFVGCANLSTVIIASTVITIETGAFESCTGIDSITIPDSVANIKNVAFRDCTNLSSVVLGSSVINIGVGAFYSCSSLTSVTIPNSVNSIGASAFFLCSNVKNVTIGSSVTSIGYMAFYLCEIENVYFNSTETQWKEIIIGSYNEGLTNATIHFAQAPHEHRYEAVVTAATCTEGGCTTYTCSCGDSYVSDETTALGHSFGEWILTTPPTTESEGEETRTCLRCGETETRAVQKLEDTQKASFTVSSGKVHPGETVEITVNAENNPGIVAAKILLDFDGELLTLTEVRNGEIFADNLMTKGNDITKVPYTVLWKDALSANNTNNGTLVTFVFTAAADAPECTVAIDIEYDPNSTFNADLNNVEFTVEGGKVEILPRIPGDPDGDGKITLKDVVIIERYLADWDVTITDMSNADVDGDGILTLKDTVLIERYLADWDVELI
ncbi:MAG: leucine-rich repeat protein [Clostridia bacterium]|nr:leucine-rich repeat protein [Clostridia bacterium]